MNCIRSFIYMLFLCITIVPYSLACLLWSPLPRHWRYKLTSGWPRLAIWGAETICGIQWEMKGIRNLPEGTAILLSNHQSAWETLFFLAYMPKDVCFVYKEKLHYLPFFGWGLALLDMIPIHPSKGRRVFQQILQKGQDCLLEQRWVLLFPEGTRVRHSQVERFKLGGALLAVHTGVLVLPIAHNAGACWPRHTFVKKPGLITVSIGKPLEPNGLTAKTLNTRVQDWISKEMKVLSLKSSR